MPASSACSSLPEVAPVMPEQVELLWKYLPPGVAQTVMPLLSVVEEVAKRRPVVETDSTLPWMQAGQGFLPASSAASLVMVVAPVMPEQSWVTW